MRLLGGNELSELPKLVEVASYFDSDGLVDSTDPDRRKSTRGNKACDNFAGLQIVGRIKEDGTLGRTIGARCK